MFEGHGLGSELPVFFVKLETLAFGTAKIDATSGAK